MTLIEESERQRVVVCLCDIIYIIKKTLVVHVYHIVDSKSIMKCLSGHQHVRLVRDDLPVKPVNTHICFQIQLEDVSSVLNVSYNAI